MCFLPNIYLISNIIKSQLYELELWYDFTLNENKEDGHFFFWHTNMTLYMTLNYQSQFTFTRPFIGKRILFHQLPPSLPRHLERSASCMEFNNDIWSLYQNKVYELKDFNFEVIRFFWSILDYLIIYAYCFFSSQRLFITSTWFNFDGAKIEWTRR